MLCLPSHWPWSVRLTLSVAVHGRSRRSPPPRWFAFSALCLAWRRRRPLLAYAGTIGALAVIAVGLGHSETGTSIIIGFIVTYSVAAYGDNLA
jgi:hypothetical protein